MSILLPLPSGCVVGRLIRREKRFFVHVLIDGKPDVAHTNNTGSMIGLLRPGAPVLLSPAQNPERKLRWTLELVWCGDPAAYPRGGFWAGVNTSTPNRMLEAAFRAGKLPWAEGYTSFAREKVRGESRLDGLLEGPGMPRLWVECKNVTMSEDDVALFPDAVATGPGRKANEHEVGLLIGLSEEGFENREGVMLMTGMLRLAEVWELVRKTVEQAVPGVSLGDVSAEYHLAGYPLVMLDATLTATESLPVGRRL